MQEDKLTYFQTPAFSLTRFIILFFCNRRQHHLVFEEMTVDRDPIQEK